MARCISVTHIPRMAKARSKVGAPKGSRAEHPRLVGFSEDENALVERAASKCGVKANPFIREAAVFQAREELGLKHPKGE